VIELARSLGLGLLDTGMDFTSRDPVGGPPIREEEHERVGAAVADRMRSLGADVLDNMTAAELLDSLDESGPAMAVLRSRLAGTAGAPLDRVSAAEIGEEYGIGASGSYVRIDGGNDRLARALARGLDVRLEKAVTSIHQTADGVDVVVRNEVFPAEVVVLAVPLAVLKRLVFEPDPPDEMVEALAILEMGVGAKVAAATAEEPPLFRRQDTDIPGWYWTGLGTGGTVRRAITGFAGSGPGVAALVTEAGVRLARSAPEASLTGEPVVVDWSTDPLAGGCYSVVGPGQRRLLERLSRPWGRLFLAGEHVNGSGTIEGAIMSGEEVVRRLIGAFVF
jgi:monoamine oxidase